MLLYWQFNIEPKCDKQEVLQKISKTPQTCHRTSRASLQLHCNNRHSAPHPTPKHTDKSRQSHTDHNRSTHPHIGTAPHIQHRRIQKQANTVTHPHNQEIFKKKPEGCAEGPWLYGPFAVFLSFPKPKTQAPCQGSKTYITK